ncbi:MAG: ornithine cyclodeaminase family protein [Oscillospiraceae bacterium]|nr:ornithine cyclodeaminase family protein [Oscillospiraceae bacterium]
MAKIRVLNKEDIKKVFTLADALKAVEQAYSEKNSGTGEIWPMVFHEFEPGKADLDIKSGNLNGKGIFGFKLVSWHIENRTKNLPTLHGTTMVFDIANGQPKALLNAGPITDYRTGAAGAIGVKYLADKDAKNLLMVGCGALAPYLVAATLLVKPDVEKVVLANPHNPSAAEERLGSIAEKVEKLLKESGAQLNCTITAEEDIETAVRNSNIILTATPSRQPMIKAEWVQKGTHISCVGADLKGKQEIDGAIFASARAFADDTIQSFDVGECEIPHIEGVLADHCGEIGEVINGTVAGRTSAEDITVFDSTGIALQDLASAAQILEAAEENNIGTVVEL